MKPQKANLDSAAFDKIQADRRLSPVEFLHQVRIETPPPGWVTSAQMAAAVGLAEVTIQKHIKTLRDQGHLTERKFTIRAGKRIMPITHYMLSPAARAVYFPSPL